MIQDWKNPLVAKQWDANGRQTNPERSEQLHILLRLLADLCPNPAILLDLGFGSGQVTEQIFAMQRDWSIIGIDYSPAMMELAQKRLVKYVSRMTMLNGDLNNLDAISLPVTYFDAIIATQSLHHLTKDRMKAAYDWIHRHLKPGGWFLLLDRVHLVDELLWPAYQSLWQRLDDLYGSTLIAHEGETPVRYAEELGRRKDRPIPIAEHLLWLTDIGFAADVVHVHANRALFVARKKI